MRKASGQLKGRRRSRVEAERLVLEYEQSGMTRKAFCGERGRLNWPASEGGKLQLSREEFTLLIGGIDLAETRLRRWYRKPVGVDVTKSRHGA